MPHHTDSVTGVSQPQKGTDGASHVLVQGIASVSVQGTTKVSVQSSAAGNLSVSAAGGATPVAFPAQACTALTVSNNTGVAIEVQQDAVGVYFQIPTAAVVTLRGIANANQIGVRRVDLAVTAVAVTARWEQ